MHRKCSFSALPCLANVFLLFFAALFLSACAQPHHSHNLSDQYWEQAEALNKQGHYLEAAGMYDKSAAAEQDSPAPRLKELSLTFNAAGYCYSLAGQHAKAIECYQQALTIDKNLENESGAAAQLFNLGKENHSLGKFDKAMDYYQQALQINKRIGKEAILATNLNEIGVIYDLRGQYDKALEYYQQALDINKKSENKAAVITQLNNIAMVYQSRAQYDMAIEYLNQAMELNKVFGNEDGKANLLNNIGMVYRSWDQYDKAIEIFQQALQLCEKFNISIGIPVVLNNIGFVYEAWGRYDKAVAYYQRALNNNKRIGNEAGVAVNLNNIGVTYGSRAQYDTAIDYFNQAMEINEKLGIEAERATNLHNIGDLYLSWGRYDTAIEYFSQALKINKRLGREAEEIVHLTKIGGVYLTLGQFDKAMEFNQRALEIGKRIGNEAGVATAFNNIGLVYFSRNQYDKAIAYFNKGLAIHRRLGKEADQAMNILNIGIVYGVQGRYEIAIEYFIQALQINKKLGREAEVAAVLSSIGRGYGSWGKFDKAVEYFKQSILILEKIRKTATGNIRRDYLASQINTYQLLASAYLHSGDSQGVLTAIEQSRARMLSERIAGIGGEQDLPDLEEVQNDLAADEAILLFSNIAYNNFILMVITGKEIVMQEISKDSFLAKSRKQYKKAQFMLLEKQRGQLIEQEVKDEKILLDDKDQGGTFDTAIHYYRNLLTNSKAQEDAGNFGRLLHELLIEPAGEQLTGKTKITIMPDGILSFLPFETLVDKKNNYLAEEYTLRYTQSLTIDKLLRQRDYTKKKNRKPMLAMGGAVYDKLHYQNEMIDNSRQLAALQNETDQAIAAKRSARSSYTRLGMGNWSNLPGTLVEVNQLSSIIKGGDTLIGDKVTESRIKQYSREGKLAEYQVLHFATHGLVVPQMPELSALVLSQLKEKQEDEDGYLRMGEIAELNLAADFVNLSACETGLGKIYGGEGVVGLTQSFLIAGANGLAVSLWQVADNSTTTFMTELYTKVQNSGMGYDQALTEVKREFINGDHGKQWQSPYYWSPFVYYGK